MWSNALRPPQEAPPDEDSSSVTYSDEDYEFSSEEDQYGVDVVEHGPWLLREDLPANMQPQDGAFQETSVAEEQQPMYRPHSGVTPQPGLEIRRGTILVRAPIQRDNVSSMNSTS